ncbi:phage tail protein [Streptococcus sp. sy004]|uniref:phage tail protein n=1 Tax=Streptococcus sp. sy004 TaxID=2600149 RepID=UPI0011B75C3B|nr:phage tail protein [Streptococcus sp. sy004]TWT12080.1 phage tail protein [Streptococcus sp. sy004]
MTTFNELVIDGVRTSSFPFQIIIKESPSFDFSESKSQLWEHEGISGAIVQTNKRRSLIKKEFTFQMVNPSEVELNRFMALFTREKFWLENEQIKTTRWWCYKVEGIKTVRETAMLTVCQVTFICHPTKFFKTTDRQVLMKSGVLRPQGSALAFPTIIVRGESTSETSFTVGEQVIVLEKFSESLVMTNNPDQPSLKTSSGKLVRWKGDFITIDASQNQPIGVVLGPGIRTLTFETVWGWA